MKHQGGNAVSTNTRDQLTDEVTRLTTLVEQQGRLLEEQRRRLEALEDHGSEGSGGNGNGNGRHSRREVLRLAGLAAAGAAGAAGMSALQSLPAAAANGGNFVLGQANNADGGTDLTPTTAAPVPTDGALFEVDGSTSPAGAVNATTGFFRSIRGVAPLTPLAGPSGVGVWGSSDAGAGVIGSAATGVDFWAFNSGRFLASAQPAGAPTYQGGVHDTTLAVWTDFELIRDANGVVWVFLPPAVNGANVAPSVAPGGTWIPLQPGGIGANGAPGVPDNEGALFSAVTTNLLALYGSDGNTFVDMARDTAAGVPAGGPDLVINITPAFNCLALLTGNADLYTTTSGQNQDIGIYVSPSSASQNIVAWKESGGSAGVNSPNAAFVQTIFPMVRGTTYNVRLKWKMNIASGGIIRAGAGPFPRSAGLTSVSPTRLTAQLIINP